MLQHHDGKICILLLLPCAVFFMILSYGLNNKRYLDSSSLFGFEGEWDAAYLLVKKNETNSSLSAGIGDEIMMNNSLRNEIVTLQFNSSLPSSSGTMKMMSTMSNEEENIITSNPLQNANAFEAVTFTLNGKNQRMSASMERKITPTKLLSSSTITTVSSASDANSLLGSKENPLTLVLQISGEIGNHLSKLIYGYGIRWMLYEDYNISTHMVLRHQNNGKWSFAVKNLQQCFPTTRQWDFGAGNTDEYERRQQQQRRLLNIQRKDDDNMFEMNPNCETEQCIRQRLNVIVQNLQPLYNVSSNSNTTNITLPFLYLNSFGNIGYINDQYHERITKDLLPYDFNNPLCCKTKSYSNESVLHIRGFLWEMPRKGKKRGYEELSPIKVATELIDKKNNSSYRKVGLVGRLPAVVQNYTQILLRYNIQARHIQDQNPMQDFCFLLSGTTLLGYTMSTYAIMAAYWGNATTANLYSLKSPERIANDINNDNSYFVRYNFTNPILRKRIQFTLYNNEEQDRIEQLESNVTDSNSNQYENK